jgi:hypothetical protein
MNAKDVSVYPVGAASATPPDEAADRRPRQGGAKNPSRRAGLDSSAAIEAARAPDVRGCSAHV